MTTDPTDPTIPPDDVLYVDCPGALADAGNDPHLADPPVECAGHLHLGSPLADTNGPDAPTLTTACPRGKQRCPLIRMFHQRIDDLEQAVVGPDERETIAATVAEVGVVRLVTRQYLPVAEEEVEVIPEGELAHRRALMEATREWFGLRNGYDRTIGGDGHLSYIDLKLRVTLPAMETRLGNT